MWKKCVGAQATTLKTFNSGSKDLTRGVTPGEHLLVSFAHLCLINVRPATSIVPKSEAVASLLILTEAPRDSSASSVELAESSENHSSEMYIEH